MMLWYGVLCTSRSLTPKQLCTVTAQDIASQDLSGARQAEHEVSLTWLGFVSFSLMVEFSFDGQNAMKEKTIELHKVGIYVNTKEGTVFTEVESVPSNEDAPIMNSTRYISRDQIVVFTSDSQILLNSSSVATESELAAASTNGDTGMSASLVSLFDFCCCCCCCC